MAKLKSFLKNRLVRYNVMSRFGVTLRGLERTIYRKIPESIKPIFEYLVYTVRTPFVFQKNINQFKYLLSVGRKEEINYVPPIFVVCISTVCNLKCPTCLYVLKNADVFRGGGFIKVSDFRFVIDKYAQKIEGVGLSGGEPLLHPELNKLVEITKNYGLPADISTNGILIKKKIGVLKFFRTINVSMDGYNYETFKCFRGGTKEQFDEILEGLSLLKKNNIEFSISFLLTEENIDKIYEMLSFGYKVKPATIGFHNINPHGSKDYKPLIKQSKKVRQILKNIISKNDYPFDMSLPVIFNTNAKRFKTTKCNQPWYFCCFDDKGNISPCCHLRHQEEFGNIFKGYDFNSVEMKNFRKLMMNHQYSEVDCLYCQRRFTREEYGLFDSRSKKWILRN